MGLSLMGLTYTPTLVFFVHYNLLLLCLHFLLEGAHALGVGVQHLGITIARTLAAWREARVFGENGLILLSSLLAPNRVRYKG
jgi:hypothetical protein